MRKTILIILIGLSIFLSSCEAGNNTSICSENDVYLSGICHDRTLPVIEGTEDDELLFGTSFDPLEGVTAFDAFDGDLTANIIISGEVDVTEFGLYFLKYSVTDEAGNIAESLRYVSVIYDNTSNTEMLRNGDFSQSFYSWNIYNVDSGGFGEFSIVDEVLVVDILSVRDSVWWEPRIHNEDIYFEQWKTYQFSFDAKSDLPRSIHVHVGQLLSSDPWFDAFMDSGQKVFDLSTEFQTFTSTFTMKDPSNEYGAILFEFGDVTGTIGNENLLTTIYVDNVEITEIE